MRYKSAESQSERLAKCVFFVKGNPMPTPRPRVRVNGVFFTPVSAGLKAWREAIAWQIKAPRVPMDGPVSVSVAFFFARPKKHFTGKGVLRPEFASSRHTQKPDRDNIDKCVLDAMTRKGVLRDDCLVCAGKVEKYWADPLGEAGALITVEALAK